MEWKDLQPIATILAALVGGVFTTIITLRLQDKKRNDDIDLQAFQHTLVKRLKEFETTLAHTNSYLSEKGKNDATKEDIEEITRKVEAIRNEFSTTSEFLRWQLSKKANLHKLQAEKEFEVYATLWNTITKLRLAFEELRPAIDLQPVGTDFQELWKKRYKIFVEHRNELLVEVERLRPFYPETLYYDLRKLLGVAFNDIIDFEEILRTGEVTSITKAQGQKNLNEFVDTLHNTCNQIRGRINES